MNDHPLFHIRRGGYKHKTNPPMTSIIIIIGLLLLNAALTFATYRKAAGTDSSIKDILLEIVRDPSSILKKDA